MNMIELKRNVFLLYDNARILFNDYYNKCWNSKEDYTEEDIKRILELFERIETNIKDFKEEL